MDNETPEVLSLSVTTVIETFVQKLIALEARVFEGAAKIDALERLCVLQQLALERLGTGLEGHQRTLEALTGYHPPSPRKALDN